MAYLGLGSNEGDRLARLRAARELLDRPGSGLGVLAVSSVYETEPQAGAAGQADFLNACLRVRTELDPEALLTAGKAVERRLGRDPGADRHAPRPVDVDVLLVGDLELRSDRLTLPHPDILERRFVLEPLLELDPDLRLPSGAPLARALARLGHQRVVRVAGPLDALPPPVSGRAR